jgi:chromosome segregation ATPase
MSSAFVHALDRLVEFKAALQTFADKAKNAMSTSALELRRSEDWLQGQLSAWKAEVRHAEEAVIIAKNELARKRMMRISDRPPDTTDQEKALRKAQARLAHAEDKKANCKSWLNRLPDAIEEYDGQAKPFQDALQYDLAKMIAYLEHKIASLDEYRRLDPSSGATT